MESEENLDEVSLMDNKENEKKNHKNPMITRFNASSTFIYDIFESQNYLKKVKDKNRIKLSKRELEFLENFIYTIKNEEELSKGDKIITINKNLADKLIHFYNTPIPRSELELFLLKEFSNQENRANFTCRKLSEKYKSITNKTISKSTIHNILKKVLGLRWRKSVIKTNKIKRKANIIMSLTFIKIITSSLSLKFNIIYCDETILQTINNHLKIWRGQKENFICKIAERKKLNLLMAITQEGLVHFKINKENTNTNTFLEYIKELFSVINERNMKPYILVLDNLKCHKTKELYEFYENNKMNIVFNSPYVSDFNAIEYSFRDLKKVIYSRIYENEEKLIIDVKQIINSDYFKKKIKSNIKETCINYLSFHSQEKNIDLNNLD